MYERPPPVEPEGSQGGCWWLAAPLAIVACSVFGLVNAAVRLIEQRVSPADWRRIAADPAVIVSLMTGGLAWAAWEGRRRGWNPNLLVLLWMASLISFMVMVSIMRSQ